MARYTVAAGGRERELDVLVRPEGLRVSHDGGTVDLTILYEEGNFIVLEYRRDDGSRQIIRAAAHFDGDRRQVWVNGRSFAYQRLRPRGAAAAPAGRLASAIPAVVSSLMVQEGDLVKAGDKLILLESMKMVIPIEAPHDGRVAAIHCAEGDAVQAGVLLIELQ